MIGIKKSPTCSVMLKSSSVNKETRMNQKRGDCDDVCVVVDDVRTGIGGGMNLNPSASIQEVASTVFFCVNMCDFEAVNATEQ